MTAVAIAAVLVIPVAALLALLRLATVLEQRRARVVARQIALTDALHAEVGALVAPIVRRGRRGRWIGVLAVPPGHPGVGLMVEIARETLGSTAEIVLVAQEPPAPRARRGTAAPALALSGARTAR